MEEAHPRASIDGWRRRVGRQMLLDGRLELHVGLVLLIGSLGNLFMSAQPHGSTWVVVGPGLMFLGYLGILFGSKRLEARMIPHSGYVVLPEGPKQRRLALALGAASILAILGMLGMLPRTDWLWSGFGILFAATFVGMGIHYRLLHLILIGLLTAILAWLFREQPGIGSWLLVSIGLGGMLAASGTYRLWRFLRANPIPGAAQ